MSRLVTERYRAQVARWPGAGRHILAQYDAKSVVAYQAYRPAIGGYAAAHGHFGGEFSLSRMSWIKTNFLWMMYRSGWGTKPGQEVTLAIWLPRAVFDSLLAEAVPSSFAAAHHADEAAWREAVAASSVRLQWDPDHDPHGTPLPRRAVQLGLRGEVLRRYAQEWPLQIEDISAFVAEQRQIIQFSDLAALQTPREEPYPVVDADVVRRLGMEGEP